MIRPVLKQAGPSENILSRLFMNSTIHISLNHVCNAVDRMGDTMVRFTFETAVRLCAALAVHVGEDGASWRTGQDDESALV